MVKSLISFGIRWIKKLYECILKVVNTKTVHLPLIYDIGCDDNGVCDVGMWVTCF
jgi:hypothetical protein